MVAVGVSLKWCGLWKFPGSVLVSSKHNDTKNENEKGWLFYVPITSWALGWEFLMRCLMYGRNTYWPTLWWENSRYRRLRSLITGLLRGQALRYHIILLPLFRQRIFYNLKRIINFAFVIILLSYHYKMWTILLGFFYNYIIRKVRCYTEIYIRNYVYLHEHINSICTE